METVNLHFGDLDGKEAARNKLTAITQSGRRMTEYSNEFTTVAEEN